MKKIFLSCFLWSGILIPQPSGFLPDSVNEWSAQDSPEVYMGENLYRLINGGADIFHEYGFNKVITQKYVNPDDRVISVEAYEMNDSSSAFGIFSLFTFNTGKPLKFNNEAYAGDGFLLFRKGIYYVSLSANESSADIQNAMYIVAEKIEKNITASGKPDLVNKINNAGYSRAAYIKGNLGLYNLRSIEFGKDFKVEEGICIRDGNNTCIVLNYKSEEESGKNIRSLINNLKNKPGYIFSEQTDSSWLINDPGKLFWFIKRLSNLIIISSSADKLQATESVKKLKNIIN